MPRVGKKPRNSYHHGDLRDAILEVASAIVASTGPAELTVRSVAARLGVTHAAIYHHFDDRAEILTAVAERGFEEVTRAIDRAMAKEESALLRYRAQGMTYIRFAVKNPRMFGLMASEAIRERDGALAAVSDALLARIRDAVVACQDQGLLIAGPPDEHVLFCWSAVHGLASLIVEKQLGRLQVPDDLEARAAIVVDRVFIGLGPR